MEQNRALQFIFNGHNTCNISQVFDVSDILLGRIDPFIKQQTYPIVRKTEGLNRVTDIYQISQLVGNVTLLFPWRMAYSTWKMTY